MIRNFLKSKGLTFVLLVIYLVILTWIVIAKMNWARLETANFTWLSNPSVLLHPGVSWGVINTTPYVYFNIAEVVLNIAFFIPFGVFMKLLNKNLGLFSIAFFGLFLSFCYEAIQYVFSIGFPDVTDLIDNTTGVILGFIVASFLKLVFRERVRIYSNIIILSFFTYILYELYM